MCTNRIPSAGHWLVMLLFATMACQSMEEQTDHRADSQQIRRILDDQTVAWNEGNLKGFMEGYWKSDSLRFVGKSGLTRGWQATLNRYERSYPDREAMGTLSFDVLEITYPALNVALVIGKWKLTRSKDDLEGHFSLVWQKIEGEWQIIADHSS